MKLTRTNSEILREAVPIPRRVSSVRKSHLSSYNRSNGASQQDIEISGINKTILNTSIVRIISETAAKPKDRNANIPTERASTVRLLESRRSSQGRIIDVGKTSTELHFSNISNHSNSKIQKLSGLKYWAKEVKPNSQSGVTSYRASFSEDLIEGKGGLDSSRPYLSIKNGETANFFFSNDAKIDSQDIKDKIDHINSMASKLVKDGVGDKKITYIINKCNLYLKFLVEKAHSRYILFPDTEKEFLLSLLGTNEQLLGMFKVLQSYINDILKEKHSFEKQVQDSAQESKLLKETIEELKREVLRGQERFSAKQIAEVLKQTKDQADMAERVWVVEKQQMVSEIENLYAEIANLKSADYVGKLKKKYEVLQSVTTAELKRFGDEDDKKTSEIHRLEGIIGSAKTEMKEMRREIRDLKAKYATALSEAEKSERKAASYLDTQNRYREMAYMSKEDLDQLNKKYSTLLEISRQSHLKFALLQSRFDVLKKRSAESGGFYVNEAFKDNIAIQEIKDTFQDNKDSVFGLKHFSIREKLNPQGTFEPLQLERYTLSKPSFSQLVGQNKQRPAFELALDEYKAIEVDREFIAIIRGIFDSKYNEFTYYNNYKQYTPFVEFVHSWLNLFHICPVQKRVKAFTVKDNISTESRKQRFCKFLEHPHITKLWDVSIFKDFIEERLASDELFFYLHCRYLLFQGPQLESCLGAAVNLIHWLRFEKVEAALKMIIVKINPDQYKTLKRKIQQKARIRKDKTFVDSALVLKILLEMYRLEKKKNIEMLKDHFLNLATPGKNNKMQISFDRFQQYLQLNFPFVCDIGKAKLYRDSWCLGNGIVDVESFLAIAHENNLFVQSLKHLLLQEILPPKVIIDENEHQEKSKQLVKLLQKEFREVSDAIHQCKVFAENLGIAEVVTHIAFKEKELNQSFFNDSGEQGQALYLVVTELVQIVERTRNHHCFVHKYTQENDQKWIERDIECLEIMGESIREYAIREQVNWMEKQNKAKKIQQMFKVKKSNWYNLLGLLINKIRKAKSDEAQNKLKEEANRNFNKYLENGIVDLL